MVFPAGALKIMGEWSTLRQIKVKLKYKVLTIRLKKNKNSYP